MFLECFPEVNAVIDDLEALSLMCLQGATLVGPGVGRDLFATEAASPVLCSAQQRTSDALPPMLFQNEPAFNKAHRLRRIATVGKRTKVHLKKARELTLFVGRHEGREGQATAYLRFEKMLKFSLVFGGSRVRPEESAHDRDLCCVANVGLPDMLIGHSALLDDPSTLRLIVIL
jgi:hypothetical protein